MVAREFRLLYSHTKRQLLQGWCTHDVRKYKVIQMKPYFCSRPLIETHNLNKLAPNGRFAFSNKIGLFFI
jgi:hypothetical protein